MRSDAYHTHSLNTNDEFIRLDPREWMGFDNENTTPEGDEFISLDSREWLGFDNENATDLAVFDSADTQIDHFATGSDNVTYSATGFDTSALNEVQHQAEAAAAIA